MSQVFEPELRKVEYGEPGEYAWYPKGPGDFGGYYGGWKGSPYNFESREECERICKMLDKAYWAGHKDRVSKIKMALCI